ncbi:MAG: nucleotide exchange factor GrpE [Bdellovibrionales bacterium]
MTGGESDFSRAEYQEICRHIVAIQKAYVTESETRRRESQKAEKEMDLLLLGVIEVLDLLDSPAIQEAGGDQNRFLRKTQRRLSALLEQFGVSEIVIGNNELTPGLVRVLESRGAPTIEVCRRGYRRGARVLRPAEVIT